MAKGNGSKPESRKIISINEDLVQAKLSNLVKDTVEDTLNGLLDAEAEILEAGVDETLSYTYFPHEHRVKIRINNPLERVMREIRRRTRVVGNFPDGNSALMLVAPRLRHIAGTRWGLIKYLKMERLGSAARLQEAVGE